MIKIAVTGPESTGKSMITQELAKHYKSEYVSEFAREFLDNLARDYNYDDIQFIARRQYANMMGIPESEKGFVFYDTELIVTKIWSEFKYGKCHPWILEYLEKQEVDLYLLMDIDLPWQPDPLREHPDKREILFDLYKNELTARNFAFEVISGTGPKRVSNAIKSIDQRFH